VRLVSGQWIYFGDLEYTDNKACNYPIQGLIGCLSKLVICWSYLHYYGTDIKMVMQIHDEMIWQVPEHLAEREKKVIEYAMVNIHPMSVPFPADIKITDNWYDGH
jgi:DNA polymerase-1